MYRRPFVKGPSGARSTIAALAADTDAHPYLASKSGVGVVVTPEEPTNAGWKHEPFALALEDTEPSGGMTASSTSAQ
jgi:hypothetical protein